MSQNALKTGLFAAADFIRPGELDDYSQIRAEFLEALVPEGPAEFLFFDEIVSANWRLRRCRLLEQAIANDPEKQSGPDDPRQISVDRARNQAHNIARRAMAELRRLQTERNLREHIGSTGDWGLTDMARMFQGSKIVNAAVRAERLETQKQFETSLQRTLTPPAPDRSPEPQNPFCKKPETAPPPPAPAVSPTVVTGPKTGRNEPCPCNSGLKFKRCCLNKPAQAVQQCKAAA
jgi:hypothetical protein